jgi:glycosyltransferase involved in cell wall biosynthesis
MKIIGLTRIRNEAYIIGDTLDHLSEYCDKIYVYDDASTDNTVKICKTKEKVFGIIEAKNWSPNREVAETENRQALLKFAQQNAAKDDWFVYIDADERIEFDWSLLKTIKANGIKMRLFDFYITAEDVNKNYKERKWMGPEYRDILMAFKNSDELKYNCLNQRQVTLPKNNRVVKMGYVKHYGKAISVKEWESTCDYYGKYFKAYSKKWLKRKGKAIHTISDFGCKLIQWHQKKQYGKLLK